MKREVTHYMEPGHWFLSMYNDDGDPQEVSFTAVIAEDMTHNCPNGCSGKGECLLGHCQCNPGFGGEDCSESVCPVLCSQRGKILYILHFKIHHASVMLLPLRSINHII